MPKDKKKCKATPPEIAARFGVDVSKVHAWIKSGELKAFNAATRVGQRPRYLVDETDLEAFELARAVVPATKQVRRKKKPLPAGFVRHFRD